MVSKKAGIIAGVIIAIIVIAVGAYLAVTATKPKTHVAATTKPSVKTLLIGVTLPFTSELSEEAQFSKCLMSIAASEVNKWLNEVGLPYRIKLIFEDDKCSPDAARKATEVLEARGVKVFVGYMCSAAFGAVIPYIQSRHYFAVSIASTSPLLRTKAAGGTLASRKYTYRMPPPDNFQGRAIAGVLHSLGMKAVCIIYRQDTWGKGLAEAIKRYSSSYGIETKLIPYPPTATDFSGYLAALSDCVKSFANKYGKNRVGIVAVSFGELAIILQQAAESYPSLLSYVWFGTDGTAGNPKLVKPNVCPYSTRTKQISTIYNSLIRQDLIKKVLSEARKMCGMTITAPTYPVLGYDAVWLTALAYIKTIVEKGSFNPDYMDKIFREVAKAYSETGEITIGNKTYKLPHLSLSGPIMFDESNDRIGNVYNIMAVVGNNTRCEWKIIGQWIYGKGVHWFVNITTFLSG